jgi:hypothetical protein
MIDFDSLHASLKLTFRDRFLPGVFEWSYADSSLTMMNVLLRFIVFAITAITFAKLHLAPVAFGSYPVSLRLAYFLDAVLLVASDPANVASFFMRNSYFRYFNSITLVLLLAAASFSAVIVLLTNEQKHADITSAWLLVRAVPFLLAFVVFAGGSIFSEVQIERDPLNQNSFITKFLLYAKLGLFVLTGVPLCIGFLTFKTEVPNERPLFTIFALILLIVVVASEFHGLNSPFVAGEPASQIMTLLCVSVYVFFFNIINWPLLNVTHGTNHATSKPDGSVLLDD